MARTPSQLGPYDRRRHLIPFRAQLLPNLFTDVLVIGGGVAGICAALAAAETGAEVTLLIKGDLSGSSTNRAQGGIAAALGSDDTPALHVADTLAAGGGLCDGPAVESMTAAAPAAIEELIANGMRFDRDTEGNLDRGREGGHRRRRILHAGGAATGRELVRCLGEQLTNTSGVRVFAGCFALDLLTTGGASEGGRVHGAITHHPDHGLQIIWARNTILASGGAGQVFRETTNPRVTTGDGLAMAYRAGAEVSDIEFVQFHPTTLYIAGAGRLLISEAVRGAGAYLREHDGTRFMEGAHEMAELAPRDVVSRAIVERLAQTQQPTVYLDVRHLGETFGRQFPHIAEALATFDLDPTSDLIPVHPSAHYTIGGIRTDLGGRTSLSGLYACGEASQIGVHGANRLGSNSLLEGLVFGARTGRTAVAEMGETIGPLRIVSDVREGERAALDVADVASSLRSATWRHVGIRRSGGRLADVEEMFAFWGTYSMTQIFDEPTGWELQNLLTVGALMTRAAAWRTETRGAHWREDHPETDSAFEVHAGWTIGSPEPALHPVVETAAPTAMGAGDGILSP